MPLVDRIDRDCIDDALTSCLDGTNPNGYISVYWSGGSDICDNGHPTNAWAPPVTMDSFNCHGKVGYGACGEEWEPSYGCRQCSMGCDPDNPYSINDLPRHPHPDCWNPDQFNPELPGQSADCMQQMWSYTYITQPLTNPLCAGGAGKEWFKTFDGYLPNGGYCLIWEYCSEGYDAKSCYRNINWTYGCPVYGDRLFDETLLYGNNTYMLPVCEECDDVDLCNDIMGNQPPHIYGCTDPEAENYNHDADVNDGSCYFLYPSCIVHQTYLDCSSSLGPNNHYCNWVWSDNIEHGDINAGTGENGSCLNFITSQSWDCVWEGWGWDAGDYDCVCVCSNGTTHVNIADCDNFSGNGDATCETPCTTWCENQNIDTEGGGIGGASKPFSVGPGGQERIKRMSSQKRTKRMNTQKRTTKRFRSPKIKITGKAKRRR